MEYYFAYFAVCRQMLFESPTNLSITMSTHRKIVGKAKEIWKRTWNTHIKVVGKAKEIWKKVIGRGHETYSGELSQLKNTARSRN